MNIYLDEFETLYGISDNIENLRNKILELALKGKLVKRQNGENAEGFHKKIIENKDKLLQKKKFRKRKFKDIDKTDIPFEIPNHWKWVRMADVVAFNLGKTPKRSNDEYWYDGKYPWIKISDYNNYDKIDSCEEKVTELAHKEKFKEKIIPKGTLIMSFKLTIGKVGILDFDSYHNEAIISIYPFYDLENTFRDFLFNFLPLLSILGKTKDAIKGSTLNSKSLSNLLIPIPSLEEQKIIVDKIEKLMTEVDKLEEKLKQKENLSQNLSESIVAAIKDSQNAEELKENLRFTINNFDIIFKTSESIDEMRNIVLQLAIEGKLVPQNESDEPASELIDEIEKEKEKLINESKLRNSGIKKIMQNDVPFEIPYNWEWVRLNKVAYINNGKSPSKYDLNDSGEYPYIKVSDMNLPKNKKEIIVSNNYTDDFKKNNLIPEYSIIFPKRGGAIATNKKRIVKKQIYIDTNTMALTPINKETFLYIKTWFDKLDLWELNSGTAVPQINNKDINPLIIPLPPLEEQKRIVKKVDSIMSIIDKLEMELEKREDLVEKLGAI